MSKLNVAILFNNIPGALLTEIDWNPNYPEILGIVDLSFNYGINSATDDYRWRFQWKSNFNFSETEILQLWLQPRFQGPL